MSLDSLKDDIQKVSTVVLRKLKNTEEMPISDSFDNWHTTKF